MSVAISWANKTNRPSVTFRFVFQYPVTYVISIGNHMHLSAFKE